MTTMKINEKKFTIEITKTFAQKASRVGSPEYYELLEVRHNFPKLKVVINQTKSKDSFKGLTYEYMKKYIQTHDDGKGSNMAVFNELRGKGDDAEGAMADSMSYGEIKLWLLPLFHRSFRGGCCLNAVVGVQAFYFTENLRLSTLFM